MMIRPITFSSDTPITTRSALVKQNASFYTFLQHIALVLKTTLYYSAVWLRIYPSQILRLAVKFQGIVRGVKDGQSHPDLQAISRGRDGENWRTKTSNMMQEQPIQSRCQEQPQISQMSVGSACSHSLIIELGAKASKNFGGSGAETPWHLTSFNCLMLSDAYICCCRVWQ